LEKSQEEYDVLKDQDPQLASQLLHAIEQARERH
jgi:hypothetical protein